VDRTKTLRNVAIVLTIAAAVYLLPGGGRAANTFEAALWTAFGIGIAYLGLRLYREHRVTLYGLGDRYRGLFYGAIALGVVAILARTRMWYEVQVRGLTVVQVHRWGGWGEIAWFALVALVVYSLLVVYRRWRTY
jgi:hypothetical protein